MRKAPSVSVRATRPVTAGRSAASNLNARGTANHASAKPSNRLTSFSKTASSSTKSSTQNKASNVKISSRSFASGRQGKCVRLHKFGQPDTAYKVETEDIPALGAGDVEVEMIAAPINPADLNVASGSYGKLPQLPSVAGLEGAGIVKQISDSSVRDLKVGDLVIPLKPFTGTWRTNLVTPAKNLYKVREGVKPEYAATLSVNPCTALRLLTDFGDLKEGDTIIQNAANSSVGLAVVQLARSKKIKTINIIRQRPEEADVVDMIKALGGTMVVTPEYLETHEFKDLVSDLPKPKLALNAVGGPVVTAMARQLAPGGTLVTYGGMSRKPIQIPTSLFIFNNIQMKGFWMSKWIEENSNEERKNMLEALSTMVIEDRLRLLLERHNFSLFDRALKRAQEPFTSRKVLLMFQS